MPCDLWHVYVVFAGLQAHPDTDADAFLINLIRIFRLPANARSIFKLRRKAHTDRKYEIPRDTSLLKGVGSAIGEMRFVI